LHLAKIINLMQLNFALNIFAELEQTHKQNQ